MKIVQCNRDFVSTSKGMRAGCGLYMAVTSVYIGGGFIFYSDCISHSGIRLEAVNIKVNIVFWILVVTLCCLVALIFAVSQKKIKP